MSKPYDGYLDKTMQEIYRLEQHGTMSRYELRQFLADAWMDGLKYSLVMIESEKRNRSAE